ncbi:MAG: bifunctional glutamate N-acetyltransferase/amino-acid acetyltransferase ArgJ [Bacillota bacterium]|jgi:glutamate N-acetyltransferase/amino-acid N-acetyltransferase
MTALAIEQCGFGMERVGVCAPRGFQASGMACGIRKEKKDLALLFSCRPAAAAAVFTTNVVKAAPLQVTARHLQDGYLQAVVINSGNANACTGAQGLTDAQCMADIAAHHLGLSADAIGVASTGVIGVLLPMERIANGLPDAALALSTDGGGDAAEAIMTTDTVRKTAIAQLEVGGQLVTIGSMAKGSGMIHPNMATMLAFITTDAAISPPALQAALARANAETFNMITVDGDTSTNDMALVLANGEARNRPIEKGTPDFEVFTGALTDVCRQLARQIAADGEGATCLLTVQVVGALDVTQARLAARTVAGSSLVKTAVFGADANWGRIMAALGRSGAQFDPENVRLWIGDVAVYAYGCGVDYDEEQVTRLLQEPEVKIDIDLGAGDAPATAWGCDLSYEYVRINGSYRT